MSKKNIITIVVAVVVMGVSIYFIFSLLFPKQKTVTTETKINESTQIVPSEFDETTYKSISTLSDFGKPTLSGIGKSDLFAGF